ncbi:MAG: hypothetical protein JNM56_37335 [Planctomycetia bacterium]|nr:hypothetical protein [Planctomycetia bacterium]
MKKGVIPKLDAQWWRKNRAVTLKSLGLGDALAAYQVKLKDFEAIAPGQTLPDEANQLFMDVQGLLNKNSKIVKSIDQGLTIANKTLHEETIAGLKLYKTKVIPDELTRLNAIYAQYERRYEQYLKEVEDGFDEASTAFTNFSLGAKAMVKGMKETTVNVQKALKARNTEALGGVDQTVRSMNGTRSNLQQRFDDAVVLADKWAVLTKRGADAFGGGDKAKYRKWDRDLKAARTAAETDLEKFDEEKTTIEQLAVQARRIVSGDAQREEDHLAFMAKTLRELLTETKTVKDNAAKYKKKVQLCRQFVGKWSTEYSDKNWIDTKDRWVKLMGGLLNDADELHRTAVGQLNRVKEKLAEGQRVPDGIDWMSRDYQAAAQKFQPVSREIGTQEKSLNDDSSELEKWRTKYNQYRTTKVKT